MLTISSVVNSWKSLWKCWNRKMWLGW